MEENPSRIPGRVVNIVNNVKVLLTEGSGERGEEAVNSLLDALVNQFVQFGDRYLGGENILAELAFYVFRTNEEKPSSFPSGSNPYSCNAHTA